MTTKVVVPCVIAIWSITIQAQTHLSAADVFNKAKSSVVQIVGSDREAKFTIFGSGFVVGKDRVVTNHHVATDLAAAVVIFSDGTTSTISSVLFDNPAADLVVLQANTSALAPLELGDESELRQGDEVFAIGAPERLALTLTNGIVSSFRRFGAEFFIQTTTAIAHGSSGGPLLDGAGRVVGITTARIEDAPGIYLSVGVTDLKRLLMSSQALALPLAVWNERYVASKAEPTSAPTVVGSKPSHRSIAPGYQSGIMGSWKAAKGEERTYFVYSESYVYGVTHVLGLRAISPFAAIGARNPLADLAVGSEIEFRTQGRYMYILVDNRETMYSIDIANPRQ